MKQWQAILINPQTRLDDAIAILLCGPLLESLENRKPALVQFRKRGPRVRIGERRGRTFHPRQPNPICIIDMLEGFENSAV